MKPSDWNDPRLRQKGEDFAAEAYELASELHTYGADASVLLLPKKQQGELSLARDPNVCIPTAFADALMALLLSLPRPEGGTGRRRGWSLQGVLANIDRGVSVRAAAKQEADRTGVSIDTIERAVRAYRAEEEDKEGGGEKA